MQDHGTNENVHRGDCIDGRVEYIGVHWEFPKNHIRAHIFDDILAKGMTPIYNTKPNEKMHGPLEESYQQRMNFKDIAEQVCRLGILMT